MRKLTLLFPLAALVLSAGCSKHETRQITNTQDGWTYSIPAEFVERSVPLPAGITQYMGPEDEGYKVNIVIESVPGSDSAEKVGKEIAKVPPAGLIVQEQSSYGLGSLSGYTVRGSRSKGQEIQRQVYVTDHGICVIFTLTANAKTFDQWDQQFHDSLASFHWTKK